MSRCIFSVFVYMCKITTTWAALMTASRTHRSIWPRLFLCPATRPLWVERGEDRLLSRRWVACSSELCWSWGRWSRGFLLTSSSKEMEEAEGCSRTQAGHVPRTPARSAPSLWTSWTTDLTLTQVASEKKKMKDLGIVQNLPCSKTFPLPIAPQSKIWRCTYWKWGKYVKSSALWTS